MKILSIHVRDLLQSSLDSINGRWKNSASGCVTWDDVVFYKHAVLTYLFSDWTDEKMPESGKDCRFALETESVLALNKYVLTGRILGQSQSS